MMKTTKIDAFSSTRQLKLKLNYSTLVRKTKTRTKKKHTSENAAVLSLSITYVVWVLLLRAIDGLALSADRSVLLDDRSFAQPLTDGATVTRW